MILLNVNIHTKAQYVGSLVGSSTETIIRNSYAIGEVHGDLYVGGLVGSSNHVIRNSFAMVEVQGNHYVGGLAGLVNGSIRESYAMGEVDGLDHIGLVGYLHDGTIRVSYATGDVYGNNHVGGLIGSTLLGVILNSYATGDAIGFDHVGGLAGSSSGGKIYNSLASGEVHGDKDVGGLVGVNDGITSIIQSSFYDTDTTGQTDTGKGEGKTTAELTSVLTFADWNPILWRIREGHYPEFRTIQLEPGTNAGTTKLTQVDGGLEFAITSSSSAYVPITDEVYDNIAVNVGDEITVRSPTYPDQISLTVGYADIQSADAPAAALEPGSQVGTTKLVGVSDLMEYRVNEGGYRDITGTSVDDIEVAEGAQIHVRVKETALQPASKEKTLDVTSADILKRISTAAIAGVTVPARGETPVEALPETDEYTAAIEWSPADSVFQPDTVYTATITLTPKAGYTLTGVPENFFTIAGATTITNAADSGVVTAVFPATAANAGGGIGNGSTPPSNEVPTEDPPEEPEQPSVPPEEPELRIFNSRIIDEEGLVSRILSKVAEVKATTPAIHYADMERHWAEKTISIFVKLQWMVGYPDGSLRPDNVITRAEFATLLNRVFSIHPEDEIQAGFKFTDIDGSWAQADIETLAAADVIRGYPDGTFKPDQTITREEMVLMIARIVNLDNLEKDITKGRFDDLDNAYTKAEIIAAAQAGIVNGKGNGKFDLRSNASRAEAQQMILNVLMLKPQLKTALESLI
jgi:hypothetical protein